MATNRNVYSRLEERLDVPNNQDYKGKSSIDHDVEQRVVDKVEELRIAFLNSKEGINYILHPNNVWISDALSEFKTQQEKKLFIEKITELQEVIRGEKSLSAKKKKNISGIESRANPVHIEGDKKDEPNQADKSSKVEAMAAIQRIMKNIGIDSNQLLDDNNEIIREEFSKLSTDKSRKEFGAMLKTYQEAIGIQKKYKKIAESKDKKGVQTKASVSANRISAQNTPIVTSKKEATDEQIPFKKQRVVKIDKNDDSKTNGPQAMAVEDSYKSQELSAILSWISAEKPEKIATRIVDNKFQQLNLIQKEMAAALSKLRGLEKSRPGFLDRSLSKIARFFLKNESQDEDKSKEIERQIEDARNEYEAKSDYFKAEQKKAFDLEIIVRTKLLRNINEITEKIDGYKKSMASLARTLERKGKSRWDDSGYLELFDNLKNSFILYKGLYENLSVLDAKYVNSKGDN